MSESIFPPGYLRNRLIGSLSLALLVYGSISLSVIMSQNWRWHVGSGLPVWKEHGTYGTGIALTIGVLLSLVALAVDPCT
ncbi:hypothetical protein [Acidobacterium sp. S8]|uniref:hypothetical protein n=1 Tax=Acidobacterium sp. S8 TaxID=1641854 RepID=UPI00131CCB17|nr:hypothetical protein [Acidobacterium sp. S8]